MGLRLLALASVNIAVYFTYTRAIKSAKASKVHGTFHEHGQSHYDSIVRSSYASYADQKEGSNEGK